MMCNAGQGTELWECPVCGKTGLIWVSLRIEEMIKNGEAKTKDEAWDILKMQDYDTD